MDELILETEAQPTSCPICHHEAGIDYHRQTGTFEIYCTSRGTEEEHIGMEIKECANREIAIELWNKWAKKVKIQRIKEKIETLQKEINHLLRSDVTR